MLPRFSCRDKRQAKTGISQPNGQRATQHLLPTSVRTSPKKAWPEVLQFPEVLKKKKITVSSSSHLNHSSTQTFSCKVNTWAIVRAYFASFPSIRIRFASIFSLSDQFVFGDCCDREVFKLPVGKFVNLLLYGLCFLCPTKKKKIFPSPRVKRFYLKSLKFCFENLGF